MNLPEALRIERDSQAICILPDGFWEKARGHIQAEKAEIDGLNGTEKLICLDNISKDRRAYTGLAILRTKKITYKALLDAYKGGIVPELYGHEAVLYGTVLKAATDARSAIGEV